MTNIEKIRTEIVRRLEVSSLNILSGKLEVAQKHLCLKEIYESLLSFIDSLPKESEKGLKWRTDKPTADVVVAEIKDRGYKIMYASNAETDYYLDDNGEEFSYTEFVKWADLEEEEKRNKTMTKEDLDIIVDYINKKSMVDCPYSNDFKVPFVCTKFCDTCIRQKASYKREKYFD